MPLSKKLRRTEDEGGKGNAGSIDGAGTPLWAFPTEVALGKRDLLGAERGEEALDFFADVGGVF